MRRYIGFLALLGACMAAWAVTMPVQESAYVWRCVGSDGAEIPATSQGDAFLRCAAAAEETPGTNWYPDFGTFRFYVEPPTPPTAVDCAGSWSAWTRVPGSETPCVDLSRNFEESRFFTVTTSPANGGAACPASPETRTSAESCGSALPATTGPTLSVAPNGRHLRFDGQPWFWIADTGWRIGHGLDDLAEITAYLEDRHARGVRVIQGPIVTQGGTSAPYDGGPDDPFILTATSVALNEPYFARIDHAVKEAGRLGIALWMAPMWGPHNDRHIKDLVLYKQYYALVAARYKTQAHVNWMVGEYDKLRWEGPNDDQWVPNRPMNAEEMTRLRAAVSAMRANGHPDSLIAMHGDAFTRVYVDWEGEQDVDLYLHQAYDRLSDLIDANADYAGKSRPFLQAEINYENGDAVQGWHVRLAAWHSALGGGAGFTYGHSLVWQFAAGWQDALGDEGASSTFAVLRPFVDRIHDEGNVADQSLLVDPGSTNTVQALISALRRADSTAAYFYVGNGRDIRVRTDQLAAGALRGRWLDPSSGQVSAEFDVARGSDVTLDPPGTPAWFNDQVLEVWVSSGGVSGSGELAIEFWPPTENMDGSPVVQPLSYLIDRTAGGATVTEPPDLVIDAPAGRKRASLYDVDAGTYQVSLRAVDAIGEVSLPTDPVSVVVAGDQQGTPMGILDVTVYPSNLNKNPGARALEADFGDLDWAHWGRSAAADFESKSGGAVLKDYVDIGSPTVARDAGGVGGAAQVSWTNGTPTATQAATTAHITNTVDSAGFRLDSEALDETKIYRFVFLIAVDSGSADLDVSLSEGSASAFSQTLTSSGSNTTYEVDIVARVDSATEFLRFDFTKVSGTNIRLQAAYVQDFGFELELHDTFTDTNGTGIESHTPDVALNGNSVYEAVGATTSSADPSGSGGMTIQSNKLQFATGGERTRWRTGYKDHVLVVKWDTSATSGHRIGLSPRHLDKANQYWFNLREPNDDYTFYTEDDDTPGQTNLLGGAQPLTLNTSASYHVRVSVIDLQMRFELDGELIREFTMSADEIPGADGVSFGVAGIGTNNTFDFVKVYSPARGLLDLAASGGAAFGVTVTPGGAQAVDMAAGASAGLVAGALRTVSADVSQGAQGGAGIDRAGGVQAVDVAAPGQAAITIPGVLEADLDVSLGASGADTESVQQSAAPALDAAAQSADAEAAAVGSAVDVGGAGSSGETTDGSAAIPVDVSSAADGTQATSAVGNFAVVLDPDAIANQAATAALQGETAVDVAAGAEAGTAFSGLVRLPLTVALNAGGGSVQAAVADYLGQATGNAEADAAVSRALGSIVDVSVLTAAEASEAIAASAVHVTAVDVQATGLLTLAAVQAAGVEVNEAGEADFTISGVLDTERIIISGEIRIIDETALIRVRRIDRGGLV